MSKVVVMDTESTIYDTGNPFARRNRLMCVGLMDDNGLRYYDIEHSGHPYGDALQEVKQILGEAELVVGFNIKHDLHWIRRYLGANHIKAVFDCQLAEFLLSDQRYPYPSLASCSERYHLGTKLDVISNEYWSKGIDTPEVPVELLKEYCLKDVELTYELYRKQSELLEGRGLMPLFKTQSADTLVLAEMEWNGMQFDTDTANQLAKETTAKLAGVVDELNLLSGSRDVNWNSPLHVSAVLYGGEIDVPCMEEVRKLRKDGTERVYLRKSTQVVPFRRLVEPLDKTEVKNREGAWYTNENVLRSLRAKGTAKSIISSLLLQSELEKLRSTYYLGIPELCKTSDWEPGYVHGRFNQCVARTGRLSSSGPNLQNFAGAIKPLFKSRNGTLVNTDAKGLEWICAAFLSQDEQAIEEILSGQDHHSLNQQAFDLPSRLIAKVFMFRLIYGGSAWSFAHDPDFTEVSTSEKYWQAVIDKTYAKYKGLHRWHTSLMSTVVDKGRLTMPTGRIYKFDRNDHGDFPRTQILNYPVQGFGADLLSIIRVSLMKRMQKQHMKSLLICTVHDSILLDAYPEEVTPLMGMIEKVFEDLPRNFERVFKVSLNVPLRCETTVGSTWGDMDLLTKEN